MNFSDRLKKAMQDLNINQAQLVGLTGIGKSSISQYLSGRNVPTEHRQRDIADSLGLASDYFEQDVFVSKVLVQKGKIPKLKVEDAAKMLSMNHDTVRKGLQQGVFPWGYAVHTSENGWSYFINAIKFAEIEGITV